MKSTLLTTTAAIGSDGRRSCMPAEVVRIAGCKSEAERQLRMRVRNLATAKHRHRSGKDTVRYFWSEAFVFFPPIVLCATA
ncbi:MAG: hypothetical protein GEU87_01365 [Alphaproteobacteria bacterium]|nr:hypothetical protein [Alphaproteobacteria bacterium]